MSYAARAESGDVFLERSDWNTAYINEWIEFPTGRHDD